MVSSVRAPHYPYRVESGVWCWWPHSRLGILLGERFDRTLFSTRYGYSKVWDIGPISIKWKRVTPLAQAMNASDIIELVGSEISWELLNADGRWYVHASHSSGDAESSCKFSDGDDDLTACVRRVANEVLEWQQEQGWPQTTGGSEREL